MTKPHIIPSADHDRPARQQVADCVRRDLQYAFVSGGERMTIDTLGRDARYGLRLLRRSPTFTLVAIASGVPGAGALHPAVVLI